MKICFFADLTHPNTSNWAGYLGGELGHEVHVVSFNRPETEFPGVTGHYLDFPRTKLRYLAPVNGVKQTLAEIRPDVVVGYRLTSYAFMAARTGFHPFVAVAQSQKAGGDHRVLRRPVQWLAARYALRQADLALAWAPHIREDMLSLGCDPGKIVVLPRGVDLRRFPFQPKGNSGPLTLITTRGLNPTYNLDTVLKAFRILSGRIRGIRYLIAGDGPERGTLMAYAETHGLAGAAFLGRVPYERIPAFLRESDLYISPVPEDGVSSSLLEAAAAGVFPVVPDIAANRYWEDLGMRIMFFDPFDAEALAEKVMEYHRRKAQYDRFLESNRQVVATRASWVDNMETLDRTFQQLISRPT